MATPANPQIATRNALRSLGIDLDAYNRLVNNGMGDEDIHLNPLIEEDDDDSDQGLEEHEIDENIMGDDAALIGSLQGLRTLAVHLSKYDGTQQIDDWLDDFDRYTIETGRDTDANKKYDLISHLTREARQWFTLQSDETKNDYAALRDALKEKFQPTKQEILDTRGQIYAMRQGPTQAFKDFAKQIQLKAKTIAMPDAEIVGICINGARPAIKAHIAMAKPASMDELLKLPVVVTEIQDEPQFSIAMLKDINDKVDYLTSVQLFSHSNSGNQLRLNAGVHREAREDAPTMKTVAPAIQGATNGNRTGAPHSQEEPGHTDRDQGSTHSPVVHRGCHPHACQEDRSSQANDHAICPTTVVSALHSVEVVNNVQRTIDNVFDVGVRNTLK